MEPAYIIFSGINGAGKTTLYKSGMWKTASTPSSLYRVNPDEIIRACNLDANNRTDQLKAGRIAVREITTHFDVLFSRSKIPC